MLSLCRKINKLSFQRNSCRSISLLYFFFLLLSLFFKIKLRRESVHTSRYPFMYISILSFRCEATQKKIWKLLKNIRPWFQFILSVYNDKGYVSCFLPSFSDLPNPWETTNDVVYCGGWQSVMFKMNTNRPLSTTSSGIFSNFIIGCVYLEAVCLRQEANN
jgi:hypothetical protein